MQLKLTGLFIANITALENIQLRFSQLPMQEHLLICMTLFTYWFDFLCSDFYWSKKM